MVAFLVRLMVALCLAGGLRSVAVAAPTGELALNVTIKADSPEPYVGEMILATLRGNYDAFITLEHFEGIELPNFTWIQLGRDVWSKDRVGGREVTTVERRLALYPRKEGRLSIGPFRHVLTVDDGKGKRSATTVVSNRVDVTIRPKPLTNGGWWLPARRLTVDDHFDMDTAHLENGATATRTVTLTVEGQTADALPPPPEMRAPWLISFIAPEVRETKVTREGPVGKVTWQWRMRPSMSEPGELAAFHIPWFDTTSRQVRDAVLKSHRIAYAAIAEPASSFSPVAISAWLLPLCLGLFLPVAATLTGRRPLPAATILARIRLALPQRETFAMRWAIIRNDAKAYRRAAARRLASRGLAPEAHLAPLDTALFRGGLEKALDLRALHRSLRRTSVGWRGDVRPK
ncbi:hypothetical protein [Aurantimonas sp. VKM B-3413]|uniref:hypothetical protein n=1 Tax=Aurantimonas sp. VKM B-3413 TaxID=2779401 RepID=UPI001E53319B|nr:hypothetical protein [Aurantimonas sp. VKM B-3413]MCB8836365.1 hypothetical protein [Aurantimonas sp. VKM B-3413]